MKLSHLRQIVPYLRRYRHIKAAHRIDDTTLKLVFDGEKVLYVHLRKGHGYLAMCRHDIRRTKIYQAPFDVMLAKRLNRTDIRDVSLLNGDKILRITVAQQGAYKASQTVLQLEFTGKNTNAVLLDERGIVLEALRHIDAQASSRVVRVGQPLQPPPPPSYTPKDYPIEDVERYLYAVCENEQAGQLVRLKKQKTALLEKKKRRLVQAYEALENETDLAEAAERWQHLGNLALTQLHEIRPYETHLSLRDYDGSRIEVTLPRAFSSANQVSDYFFRLAKKARQKARYLHIEREGLEGKIRHLKHFIAAVKSARTVEAISRLFPPKMQAKRREKDDDTIETFWIEGYKVRLGKNERGNIALLQQARARDIWMHLRERPGAHVVITTDKQKIPQSVLEAAAKLCADFSVMSPGVYEVDYTPRREIRIQEGANVLYNRYETLSVRKA